MSIATARPPHTDALVIKCNRCVAVINVGGAVTHDQARALAARAGWTTVPTSRAAKDLCPRCQEGHQ
jgi:Fe2+ or Zn2+ uptake regulation protein